MTDHQKIRDVIEKALLCGRDRLIICPFGDYGMLVKRILNESFGVQEKYIIDSTLSKYNSDIKAIEYFRDKDTSAYTVLLASADPDVRDKILELLLEAFDEKNVIDIFSVKKEEADRPSEKIPFTKCGKYSYGPLCDHWLVEAVGAFSSFAIGTDVVPNHPTQYISTHPFLYHGRTCNRALLKQYDEYCDRPWYMPGVRPRGKVPKLKRTTIGNDVWLGKNVLITNGADIGNGVIAAAGAVITKDVPDYAVVAGVPARIIRYRFTPAQINELNKIAWWDWTDEKIREYYDDFFEDIDVFIKRHKMGDSGT